MWLNRQTVDAIRIMAALAARWPRMARAADLVALTGISFVNIQNTVHALGQAGLLDISRGRHSPWAAMRRVAGLLGHPVWRAACFRSASELERLAAQAGLGVRRTRGAIFCPRCDACARRLAFLDRALAPVTTFGAAFIALAAEKPAAP